MDGAPVRPYLCATNLKSMDNRKPGSDAADCKTGATGPGEWRLLQALNIDCIT